MCYSLGMTVTLTQQQQAGLDKVAAWYNTETMKWPGMAGVFRWFGYAGTGKTFTAARIPEHLGLQHVVFGTYTGKAASVLRKSLARYGVHYPVSTIHSAIYKPTTSKAARDALDEARDQISRHREVINEWETLGGDGVVAGQNIAAEILKEKTAIAALEVQLPQLEANARRLRFEFNPESEWASADLIILDEVSMVNAKLAADIESFGVPVLVLGDPAQLPPVEGGGYYTDAQPDHLLTEIQRAAWDSPVTQLATRVRQSQDGLLGLATADTEPASLAAAEQADVVLCWTNSRRWKMINAIRERRLGPKWGPMMVNAPVPGDSIMVLTNNKDAAVFNGELFQVLATTPDALGYRLQVVSDAGQERELLTYADGFKGFHEQSLAKGSGMGARGERLLATFGQAITVHKAQGSEWPHVYVVNELPQMIEATTRRQGRSAALEQARSWLYTACTRASERVTITRPKRG